MNFKKFVLKIVHVIISITQLNYTIFIFGNILINEKSHKNILIMAFHIALYLINPKPLHIRFNEIDLFIRIFDGTRYLVLLGP